MSETPHSTVVTGLSPSQRERIFRVLQARKPVDATTAGIPPQPRAGGDAPILGEFPLSYAQQRLWFFQQWNPESAFTLPASLRLRGRLAVAALEEALTALVRRHEILRTRFVVDSCEAEELAPVLKVFEFRVSHYYANLIDWSNPHDPLRQIVLPHRSEIDSTLDIDASDEQSSTRVHGLQHKYRPTALLLVNDVCSAYCRFCFRKRFTLSTTNAHHILPPGQREAHEKETTFDISDGLQYIAQHPEIDNVLVTGGDPLTLAVGRLERIIEQVRAIPHVRTIRIGSKVPAFDPENVTDELLSMLSRHCTEDRRIYLIVHFNHARELTATACRRLEAVLKHGIQVSNQSPLLKGVNDSVRELTALHQRLAAVGVAPYYVFHCRPTQGNERFMLTLQDGLRIVNEARQQLSGLAKRFRYVGSHASGKIEIIGALGDQLVLKYHEARDVENENRLMTWPLAQPVLWFDEIVRASPAAVPALV